MAQQAAHGVLDGLASGWDDALWPGTGAGRLRAPDMLTGMNPIQPKKLLLSKWTAVRPVAREKHFLVAKLLLPEAPAAADSPLEWVEIEAVHSGVRRRIAWRELQDDSRWRQGWV